METKRSLSTEWHCFDVHFHHDHCAPAGRAKRILLFLNYYPLFLFDVYSRVLKHERRGDRTGNARRESDVQGCFDQLSQVTGNYGCSSRSQGNCRCTVDSSFIWDWTKTFGEARQRLYEQCSGFTNNVMERYEGNMYLTPTCD